jgi:hypothetical protein
MKQVTHGGNMKITATGLLVGVTTALIAGCATLSFDPPVRAHKHEDVGSIHFSVLSVGDWNSYREALQPKFGLKSADSLALSMMATRTIEDSLLDAVRLGVAVQGELDTTSTTRTNTRNADNIDDTQTTDTTSTTRTETTGPLTDSAPAAPTANGLPSGLRATLGTLGTPPNTEPVLRYQNANAIYQAVHLLDRYIADASKREGWQAHVVTLQVSVLPSARRRPYDAYANITFRPAQWGKDDNNHPIPASDAIIPFSDNTLDLGTDLVKQAVPVGGAFANVQGVVVIPLIATDQMETSIHSRQTDQIQQLALSLALLQGNLGLGADFQRFSEKLRRALGRDVNSLLTVARLTDDTVRIRMGAMQAIDTDYALVPRTHMVSLLLLTPPPVGGGTGEQAISALMMSEFRDVETGEALPPRTRRDIHREARDMLKEFDSKEAKKISEAQLALLFANINSQRAQFEKLFGNVPGLRTFSEHIRLALASMYVGSQYGTTVFAIPGPPNVRTAIAAPSQPYALYDDGKKAVLAFDAGAETLVASKLAGIGLSVGNRVHMLPSAVSIDPALRRASVTFVSTKKLNLVANEPLTYGGQPVHVVNVEEEKKPPAGVAIASGAQMVWADAKRAGTLLVRVDFPDKEATKQVVLTITGADVSASECAAPCTAAGGTFTVTADAAVKFTLANLGTAVTVSGKGEEKADPVTITLPVVSLPLPPGAPDET